MNIFRVHDNPRIAAKMLCDKHVVKMILETAQMLSVAHHETESPLANQVYKSTHKNHPCSVWIRQSRTNYMWALRHLRALLNEYTYRYRKIHKTSVIANILSYRPKLPNIGATEPPQAMYDNCKSPKGAAVQAYRNYYRYRASEINMRYTRRRPPKWLRGGLNDE